MQKNNKSDFVFVDLRVSVASMFDKFHAKWSTRVSSVTFGVTSMSDKFHAKQIWDDIWCFFFAQAKMLNTFASKFTGSIWM